MRIAALLLIVVICVNYCRQRLSSQRRREYVFLSIQRVRGFILKYYQLRFECALHIHDHLNLSDKNSLDRYFKIITSDRMASRKLKVIIIFT